MSELGGRQDGSPAHRTSRHLSLGLKDRARAGPGPSLLCPLMLRLAQWTLGVMVLRDRHYSRTQQRLAKAAEWEAQRGISRLLGF